MKGEFGLAAMMGEFGLLGVPFSAAAHGPGQEKAPAALRRAGLWRAGQRAWPGSEPC
jgi:arginase family enzyme